MNPYLKYTQIGMTMLVGLVVFGYIGKWADAYFGFETPYLTAFCILFFVASFLTKLILNLLHEQKQNKP